MAVWSERLEKKLQDYTAYHTGFDDGKDEGIQTGLAQGIKQGVQTGIEQEKVEIVLNMNKNNISLDLISKCANLSIEEVEKIIENQTK